MTQKRVTIYGDLIDVSDMPTVVTNMMSAGRLIGFDFIVSASDLMQISAGSCLLPNGVLVIESEVKSLVIPNSSLATDYTVVYQLEDTLTLGGSPAILRLLSGIQRQEDFTDGTILGWIRYAGGSVPLDASFFIQPTHLRIIQKSDVFYFMQQCPLNIIRPSVTTGWNETTEFILNEACTRFVNNQLIPDSYNFKIPFTIASAGQPRKLITRLIVDFNCLVTCSINLKGTTVVLSPNSGLISNTGTIITREFDIPMNSSLTWEAGTTAYIEINIESQPSRGAGFAYVGMTMEPTPFTLFT